MYFLELLVKKFIKKNKIDTFNPLEESSETIEDTHCEHIFMPLDSSGERLACTKCGLVVNRKDLKKRNIFRP